jgi:protein TonB
MEFGEEVRIEGGRQAGIVVLGNAFDDMIAAGEPAETVDALEAAQTSVEPMDAQTVVPDEAEIVSAVPSETTEAGNPDTALPVTAMHAEPVEAQQAATATDLERIGEADPSTESAAEAEPAELVRTQDAVVALAQVPVPTPRPAYTPPPKPEQAEPATSQRRQATRQAAQSGSRGNDASDARRGAADGGRSPQQGATQRSESRIASTAGNAAVSNYPGKIVSKLRRSLRYPAQAKRARVTGEVHVRFVVTANGAAGAISIVRGSGSPILDQAAVEAVKRAAPFPAIPREAGRNSWPFTVPLAFTR